MIAILPLVFDKFAIIVPFFVRTVVVWRAMKSAAAASVGNKLIDVHD